MCEPGLDPMTAPVMAVEWEMGGLSVYCWDSRPSEFAGNSLVGSG